MSEDIRKMIDKVKNFKQFVNENNTMKINDFTETEQFRSWFGNSKVVDNEGKPLPVYHGSPIGGIEVFKKKNERGEVTSSGLKEFGIFFTTSLELARKYKTERKLSTQFIEKINSEIEKLKNILYNTRNSRDYDLINSEIEKLKKKLQGGIYQSYLKIKNPYIFDAKGKDGYYGWKELKIDIGYKTAIGIDAIEALSGHNDMYKSKYDGIIAKNIIDLHIGNSDLSNYRNFGGNVYMVFSPSQVLIEREF